MKAQCLLNNIGDVKQLSRLSIPELMTQGELTQHMAHRFTAGFNWDNGAFNHSSQNNPLQNLSKCINWSLSLLNQGNEFLLGST